MKKVLFALLLGVSAGYFVGFDDAQSHKTNVLTRLVHRVGGSNRGRYGNDIDRLAEQADR